MALSAEIEETLRRIAAESASRLGLELLDLTIGRSGKRWHVRVDIERPGPAGVGLADCQAVSESVGAALEEGDLFPDSYVLEVSSPGIDRPIRSADDVRRNAGRRVVVETREPLGGRRSFSGVLLGMEGACLRLRSDEGDELDIPLDGIAKARQEAVL